MVRIDFYLVWLALATLFVVGEGLLRAVMRWALWIRVVNWVGLSGSEELFCLLSRQVEESYQGLSAGESSD